MRIFVANIELIIINNKIIPNARKDVLIANKIKKNKQKRSSRVYIIVIKKLGNSINSPIIKHVKMRMIEGSSWRGLSIVIIVEVNIKKSPILAINHALKVLFI